MRRALWLLSASALVATVVGCTAATDSAPPAAAVDSSATGDYTLVSLSVPNMT